MLKTAAGADGTLTAELKKITTELDPTGATSLAGKIAKATDAAALDIKDAYGKLEKAVEDANTIIDEALKSNDLTELDTTNLKALRSYINETKDTFDTALKDSNFDITAAQAKTPTKEQIAKLQAGSSSAKELGDTATEKATATHKFCPEGGEISTSWSRWYHWSLGSELKKVTSEFGTGNGILFNKIDTAVKGTFPPATDLNFKTEYDKFKKAVDASVDIIDEALETNDLTELDTSNLRALRSYLTETLATVDTAIKDSGLDKTAPNKKDDVTKEKLEKIQAGLNSANSKAAMEKTLETDGIIESLNNTGGTGLAKAFDTINAKFNVVAADISIPKADYEAVEKAIEKITTAIADTLESGDLTQLDTSNLKALKISVENVGKAFASISEMKLDAGTNSYKVGKDDFDKVKDTLAKITEASKEEAGASATKALDSSKAQAENIGEMQESFRCY